MCILPFGQQLILIFWDGTISLNTFSAGQSLCFPFAFAFAFACVAAAVVMVVIVVGVLGCCLALETTLREWLCPFAMARVILHLPSSPEGGR